ncbi:hypothetical protein AB6A40_004865 [Gnathostoma spinigerum]|uniref:Uncharacterized protein n=1 Tax=Gnathostoma spinigerum TaxID=75299 RepID=A0ABD6EES8_9BILA
MRTSSLNGYQHSSGSGTTTSSTASRSSTKSYSTSTTDRQNDDESDSDNVNGTPARQMRPTRKGRRRANPTSVFAVDNSSHTQIVAQPPPSSGYQSQNASGSSNSNSPVERSSNCMTTHPNSQMPLQIANPMYSTHLNGPSTSAVATFESNVRLGHCRRTKSPASEIRTKTLQNPNYSTSLSHHPESSYDGSKSSVPRTNPRCSGRLSLGGFPVNAISKSSFNDDHEPECSTVVATPARTTCDADQNDENQKQNGIWTPVEIRPPVPDHGRQPVRKNEQNTSPTQNPQEIIEQQKREIMRLMRENEELKRHVARNQVRQKRHFQTAKPNSPQKLIDSGASDDSYDSLNSLNDLPSATLEQNTTTRC